MSIADTLAKDHPEFAAAMQAERHIDEVCQNIGGQLRQAREAANMTEDDIAAKMQSDHRGHGNRQTRCAVAVALCSTRRAKPSA